MWRAMLSIRARLKVASLHLFDVSRIRQFELGDFVRHGAIVFAASMTVNVFNYIFHFYMTRHLGPISYGELSSLLALTSVMSLPAAILTLVIVKYASELHAVADAAKLRALTEKVFSLSGFAAVIVAVITIVASAPIAHYLHEGDILAVVAVGVIVAIGLMTPGLRGVLQGVQNFGTLAIVIGIEGFGKCAFGIALAAAGLGLRGALIGYALGSALSLISAVGALSRYRRVAIEPLRIDFRRLLASFVAIAVATAALQVASFMDVILVKHYFTAGQAGIYSGVALAGKVMLFVVGFMPSIVLPKAVSRASKGQRPTPVLVQALGLSVAISGATLILMFVAPQIVMRVFSGTAYLVGAVYLFRYALAMTFLAGASTVVNYQIALHRFHFVVPLVVAFLGELGVIMLFHSSISAVLTALIIGNGAMFSATFYAPRRVRFGHSQRIEAA